MHVGYELLTKDSGWGVEHWVDYHKLISNKHERDNCLIIKYQTLYKYIYIEFYFLPTWIFGLFEGDFPW